MRSTSLFGRDGQVVRDLHSRLPEQPEVGTQASACLTREGTNREEAKPGIMEESVVTSESANCRYSITPLNTISPLSTQTSKLTHYPQTERLASPRILSKDDSTKPEKIDEAGQKPSGHPNGSTELEDATAPGRILWKNVDARKEEVPITTAGEIAPNRDLVAISESDVQAASALHLPSSSPGLHNQMQMQNTTGPSTRSSDGQIETSECWPPWAAPPSSIHGIATNVGPSSVAINPSVEPTGLPFPTQCISKRNLDPGPCPTSHEVAFTTVNNHSGTYKYVPKVGTIDNHLYTDYVHVEVKHVPQERLCSQCNNLALWVCSLCSLKPYCSRECQVRAWPAHRMECRRK